MFSEKKTVPVSVGNILIGGDNPVVIQSMTNTDTDDINKTVKQIIELYEEGSEIVRITVDRPDSAKAVPYIKEEFRDVTYFRGIFVAPVSDLTIRPFFIL